jgi:endonuclease YncB( thermonuclease family)
MRQHLSLAGLSHPHCGNVLALAGAMFALGLAGGATIRSPLTLRPAPVAEPARGSAAAASTARLDPQLSYPADVIRVIDGDTFEARVRVWPGLDVDTKVRLRGIDAPELHSRCSDEHVKAEAARSALEKILADGGVAVSRVGVDKYGARVDAAVSTHNTGDVSAAMLTGGFARSYDGRRRGSWCG